MRSRSRAIGVPALILPLLSATLAGCSSGGTQETFTSSNLRPEQGVYGNAPRRYPDGSTYGGTYSNSAYGRRYVEPGQPTPREIAAYDSGHGRYGPPKNIQTASIGQRPYDPEARWQQPASGITTGSTSPREPAYRAPDRQSTPYVVEVAEGDTLYSLSRRYNVPMGNLIAANRLSSERIAVGQRLVIPTRYR